MFTPFTIRLNRANKPGFSSIEIEMHDENDRYLNTIRLTDARSLVAAELLMTILGESNNYAVTVQAERPGLPVTAGQTLTTGCPECAVLMAAKGPTYRCERHFDW